jgi:hypothetical protein
MLNFTFCLDFFGKESDPPTGSLEALLISDECRDLFPKTVDLLGESVA